MLGKSDASIVMIYVCVAARNHEQTVGLVLWKVRQIFQEFRREYHLLVADDASTDDTAEVLEPYQRALPMTVIRAQQPLGYGASLERLIRHALDLTDRPRRDCLVTVPADFSVSPAALPDLIKRTESGADVVVGEALQDLAPWGHRLVRRSAAWLLRPGLHMAGFRDVVSGTYAIRLVTLANVVKKQEGPLLRTHGWCANAELVARAAAAARQIAAVTIASRRTNGRRGSRTLPVQLALNLIRTGRSVQVSGPRSPIQRGA